MLRRVRVLLGSASLGLALVSAVLLTAGRAEAAPSARAVALDRQDYRSDAGPDLYQASAAAEGGVTSGGSLTPDPVDIHVAAAPSTMTYHSFVHLELPATPAGFSVGSVTMTLFPTTNPQRAPAENVNTSQVILDAYPLTTELPAKFDANNPPGYDANVAPVVGKINNTDGSWSFDLTRLVAYWAQHGNTGAAIVPDAGAAMQPWSIGLDRTLSVGSIVFTPVAGAGTSIGATVGGGAVTATSSASSVAGSGAVAAAPVVTRPLVPPTVAPAATTAASAASSPRAPAVPGAAAAGPVDSSGGGGAQPAVAPAAGQSGGIPLWLVVLLVSGVAAVGLLAQPVSQALGSASGAWVGALTQWRLHPRLIVVAGGLVAWSSAFSVYATTVGRSPSATPSAVAQAGTATQGTGSPGSGDVSGDAPAATPSSIGSASGGTSSSAAQQQAAGGPSAGHAPATHTPSGTSQTSTTNPFPNAPNPTAADLYSGADDTVGITRDYIQLCAHAALTFGPAFNIGASDLNVFWQMIDEGGGIYGRKVVDHNGAPGLDYVDDGYQPSKAVTAAQQCADYGTFFLLGGIGFDQIPAVRVWAEQNHMIYIHHIATEQGTGGLQYSFTMLPTLEQVGTSYAQYALAHLGGEKIGIIYRNSSNWDPGRATFKQTLAAAGKSGMVCDEEPVNNNQGDYTTQIVTLSRKGCTAVFIWENALAAEQIIQQSSNQSYNPKWLLFPFNLTLQTLNQAGVDTSQMQGVVPWPSYTCNSANDPRYAAYKADIQEFEAAYKKYDSGANLCGVGGDLLFGAWEAWKQTYDLLIQCGPSCTRNKIAGLMENGYHARVGSNCTVDFRNTDGHHGGTNEEDVDKVEQFNGANVWVTMSMCQSTIR